MWVLLAIAGPAHAQAPKSDRPQQAITVQLFGGGQPTRPLYVQLTAQRSEMMALADLNVAGPYLRDLADEVVFYQEVPDPVAVARWRAANPPVPGQPSPPLPANLPVVRKALASQKLPAASPNVLILVYFTNDVIKNVLVFDQRESVLASGQLGLINTCSQPVAIRLGEGQAVVPPQSMKFLPMQTKTGKPASVPLQYGIQGGDGAWQLVDDTSLVVNPKRRRFALIMPGGNGITLQLLQPAEPDPKPLPPSEVVALGRR